MRDFASVAAFLGDREIDELQASIDARRESRARRPGEPPAADAAHRGSGSVECNGPDHPVRLTPQRQSTNKEEVAVDKAEGKAKEAYGAIVGDEAIKEEGRALQRKAQAEKEAEQREKTRRAQAAAKQAEKERDEQELKDKGLLGDVGDTLPKL